VCEKRLLRRIFGPNRDEIPWERRKQNNEELNNWYSPNIIRVIKSRRKRWTGHVAGMGIKGAYRVLVGTCDGNRQLGRHRRRLGE
jgi:hypothetical protein